MKRKTEDKYACFQWIRDIREEMARDMEGMTPEERAAYMNARGEKARQNRHQFTPEEARKIREEILHGPLPTKKKIASKPAPARIKIGGRKSAPVRSKTLGRARKSPHVGS